eukprot:jgi/Picsp_1/3101/NSC_05942-R1_expressed protein [Chlorella variabilis]
MVEDGARVTSQVQSVQADDETGKNKRPADVLGVSDVDLQQKKKKAKKEQARPSTVGKVVKRREADASHNEEGKAGAPKLSYYEEQEETKLLMQQLEERRKKSIRQSPISTLQLLSEYRIIQEVAQQQKETQHNTGLSAIRSGSKASELIGCDEKVLEILQLGIASHLRDLISSSRGVALQRREGSQKHASFTLVEDVRVGVGEIRRREERIAKKKAEEEREMLLRAAGHRRADEETRERAQKAREELVGKQQAVAANKALAATLGGGSAKWANWGSGTSDTTRTTKEADKNGDKPTEDIQKLQTNARKQAHEENPAQDSEMLRENLLENDGASDLVITPHDLIAAMESFSEYSNSHVLFNLINQSFQTDGTK